MTDPGTAAVLDVRLTGLADAIRRRDWDDVEREYDRVRSTIDRELGVRARPSDLFRQDPDSPAARASSRSRADQAGAE